MLALGGRPPDVEAVDADAVGLERVAGVAGERHQRALGGRVGGQHGLAPVAGHRDDVHHAAAAGPAHQPRRLLREQERRARVDREQPVPQLDAGVVHATPGAQAGGVDEPVHAPEVRVDRRHHREHRLRVRELDGHEVSVQLGRDGLSAPAVAPADRHARSQGGGAARDRGAEPLGAAGDDDHLAVEAQVAERVAHALSTSSMRTGRPSRSERQAAMPITSGARASGPVTSGVVPAAIAATNASHSPR